MSADHRKGTAEAGKRTYQLRTPLRAQHRLIDDFNGTYGTGPCALDSIHASVTAATDVGLDVEL
eukprot:1351-Eustigmatos_ZCMA.PRE.1